MSRGTVRVMPRRVLVKHLLLAVDMLSTLNLSTAFGTQPDS